MVLDRKSKNILMHSKLVVFPPSKRDLIGTTQHTVQYKCPAQLAKLKKVYFATTRQCLKGFSDTLQCNKFSPLIFGSVNLLKRCFFNIFKTFFMILFSNRLFYNDLFIMTCLYTEFLYNSLFVYSTFLEIFFSLTTDKNRLKLKLQ